MNEAVADAVGAGQRLRQGREAAGLSLDAMAVMLKVPSRKVHALEEGRLQDLPDVAFARALALAQCRALRIDSDEVLGLLPRPEHVGRGLEHVNAGLGEGTSSAGALRPRSRGVFPTGRRRWNRLVWLLMAGLVAFGLWLSFAGAGLLRAVAPEGGSGVSGASVGSLPPSSDAQGADPSGVSRDAARGGTSAAPPALASAPAALGAAVAKPGADAMAVDSGSAVGLGTTLMARSQAWVRVADADDRPLLERTLSAGETVVLDSRRPLRLELGNVSASVLMDKGRQIDLAPWTRDNVARLVLE
jgi:cytoskeleton protein RodZ